jgi:hypothetical protein
MNAFYALDDIKKRTQKFYEKLETELMKELEPPIEDKEDEEKETDGDGNSPDSPEK